MDKELLATEHNATLYDKVMLLKAAMEKDFPDRGLPQLYVTNRRDHGTYRYSVDQNGTVGHEITIGHFFIEQYGVEETVARIAHEYGHFVLKHHEDPIRKMGVINPQYTKEEIARSRSQECGAEHVAAQYELNALRGLSQAQAQEINDSLESPGFLYRFKAWQRGYESPKEMFQDKTMHPLPDALLSALDNESFLNAPIGTPFTPDCRTSLKNDHNLP